MDRATLVGIIKIELPGATIRLCDGGFVTWGAETFTGKDAVFGAIGSLEALTEGVGEEIPALGLTLLPAATSAPADLSQPGFQRSAVRLWIAEVDDDTGAIVGDPELVFYGQIDQTVLTLGRTTRDLALTIVSTLERLFLRNEGNSLSPAFHKSVWPGETGHDNATGLTVGVAWGAESSKPASGFSGGGGGPIWRFGAAVAAIR